LHWLETALQNGRLAHGYLLVGPRGVGKRKFADLLAACLLCLDRNESTLDACGQCDSCRQLAVGSNADLVTVACPAGKSEIPISLLLGADDKRGREGLCHDIGLKPVHGHRKVAIIDDADRLNEEGANALLKTLEEPPPGSVLLLIAASMDRILPTIRSRCQVLRFDPLPTEDVAALLVESGDAADAKAAAAAAAMSGGSLDAAREWLDPPMRLFRDDLTARLSARRLDPVELSRRSLELVEAAGEAAEQREFASRIVRMAMEFYRQAVRQLLTGGISADSPLAGLRAALPPDDADAVEALVAQAERCHAADQHLSANAVVGLCLETLFGDLAAATEPREPAGSAVGGANPRRK
jgi:DNA polymerase-3 subunit delta'